MSDYEDRMNAIMAARSDERERSKRAKTYLGLNLANDLVDGGSMKFFWFFRDLIRYFSGPR